MFHPLRVFRRTGTLAAMALIGAACSNSTGNDTQLSVLLTDAPHPLFESANVTIGEISIIPADGAPIVLTSAGGSYDLLQLQDGVTANLATLSIDAGNYVQLRLVVTEASVTLKDGFQFNDGSITKTLVVPSGAQTGIKINLSNADGNSESGIEISGATILVVDFDVSQNFVVQGSLDTPAGINGVLFTPLLRAVVQNIAGSIAGTVTDAASAAVAEATVRATLQSSGVMEALQTAEATAMTAADGTYTIQFLSPGTYSVTVDDTNVAARTVVVGTSENVTGVDFTVN